MSQTMDSAIEQILERGQQRGLQMDVLAVHKKSTAIGFQDRKMDQFSFSETRQLGVRVLDGLNEGVAYTESLSKDSLEEVLLEAEANSKMILREFVSTFAEPLAQPELPGLYDATLETVDMADKIRAAQTLESVALDLDPRLKVPGSRYFDSLSQVWVANSKGLRSTYKTGSAGAYVSCLASDGEGRVTGHEVSAARNFAQIHAAEISRLAGQRALERIGAERPKTGRYTVVFENREAETLFEFISGYFSAKAIDEKTSPLVGQLGQKIFASGLNLSDDPRFTAGTGARPFDEEGYTTRVTPLIENGTLRNFLTNSVLAQKLKLPHTASASRSPATELDVQISNLRVQPGSASFKDLVSADKNVIVITSILGHSGFREASGDFSLPVEGQLYVHGQRHSALKDFLISGNILQVMAAVEAVGNDALPPIGQIQSPSILVRDLNVSGQA